MNLERKLQKWGYDISGIASNADSAVQQAMEKHPQLVLMDIALEGSQDGIQAARKMHDLDIPVVYLSALSDAGTLDHAKGTEPFGYLVKPVEEKSLQTTIELAFFRHEIEKELKKNANDLQQSNQELERFASIASHDLREPLRTITCYLRLIEREPSIQLSSQLKEYLDVVLKAAPRMQVLIDDLLEYSQLGQLNKEKRSGQIIDCNSSYRVAVTNLTAAIQESNAQISCDPLPNIIADETELTQVFQNLLSNAIKFQGDRTPQINITCEASNGYWLFAVRDNGIGIAPPDREGIFNAFQRLHTRSKYEGTGIGLTICKKIVESYGGKIWVDSIEGEGSTFLFTLPVSNPSQTKSPKSQ